MNLQYFVRCLICDELIVKNLLRPTRIRRRVIHRFYGIANRNIFGGPRDSADAGGEPVDPEAQKQAASKL